MSADSVRLEDVPEPPQLATNEKVYVPAGWVLNATKLIKSLDDVLGTLRHAKLAVPPGVAPEASR